MKEINEYVEEMLNKSNTTVDRLLIDDILDIYNGVYKSYEDYVECKRNIVDMVRKHNNQYFNPHNENDRFTYYVEPVILRQVVFYYIVNKCL